MVAVARPKRRSATGAGAVAVALAVAFAAACDGDGGDGASTPGPADHALEGGLDADAAGSDAASSPPVVVGEDADAITADNGFARVRYAKATGLVDLDFPGRGHVHGAYASVDLGAAGGGYVTSKSYATHTLAQNGVADVHDGFGEGKSIAIVSTSSGRPDVTQTFTLYRGKPYLLASETVGALGGPALASRYLGALIVDGDGGGEVATEPPGPDARVLDVPYDNDEWARYDARVLSGAFSGTGYEVGAVYESASRHGVVVGSITHDFWKTGFYYEAKSGGLARMNVWGGAATPDATSVPSGPTYGKDGTHDVAKHGEMTGAVLTSPTLLVGGFDDWRAGLVAFGQANAIVKPAMAWSGGVPFGWSSWGAFGLSVTQDRVLAASDGLATLAKAGFSNGGVVYVNVDAGLGTDPAPLVAALHQRGQRAGVYRVPFAYFPAAGDSAPLSHPYGSGTYADVVLRDDAGTPIERGGAYALDVTHPLVKAQIAASMKDVARIGADYVKLDFLTHGALEGKHADPAVKTGVQAYAQAMALVTDALGPGPFVSLSIAPLFPHGFGHARRISTDVLGQLDDVMSPSYPHYGSIEYMLNGLTFGFWQSGTIYAYGDPDAVALLRFAPTPSATDFPVTWAKTHLVACAIAGTVLLDGTDLSSSEGLARAQSVLTTSPRVLDVARAGVAFWPLDGATGRVTAPISGSTATASGSEASDVFVRRDGRAIEIAAFDYDASNGKVVTVDLARAGLAPGGQHRVRDLVADVDVGGPTWDASLTLTLGAGEAKLVRVEPWP